MGHVDIDRHRQLIVDLAARGLAQAADVLEQARSVEEFTLAIEVNRGAWLNLARSLPTVAVAVPHRLLNAGIQLAVRSPSRLDDHMIEMLISLDRRVSAAIVAAPLD